MSRNALDSFNRQVAGLNLNVSVLNKAYPSLDVVEAQHYRILSLLCRINNVSVSLVLSCFVKKECTPEVFVPGLVILPIEEVIERLVSDSLPSVFKVKRDFEQGSVSFTYPWYYSISREPGEKRQYRYVKYAPGLKERIKALPWLALGFTASKANDPADPGIHTYIFNSVSKT
nr:hypothetical protein [Grapevine virus B]